MLTVWFAGAGASAQDQPLPDSAQLFAAARETLMRAGDTLVQRGTNHAWSNRSDQPSLVAFVLVSAAPLGGKGAAAKPVKRAAARAGRGSPSTRPSRRTTARPRRKPRPR